LAGYATLAALKDTEFIENTKRTIAKERAQFAKMFSEIRGFHVFPSETNFLLVKILNPKYTSTMLKEQMAGEGILIRDCNTFVGLDNSYFRVTVRSPSENLKLINTLKDVLKKNA
jgi:histidinol-phosphate/aromatic aminotransferase/cobyric acid decarboxylase-like protein